MITFELSLDDLLSRDFAVSAPGETIETTHALAGPGATAGHAGWLRDPLRATDGGSLEIGG
jgi:hypothetical protein